MPNIEDMIDALYEDIGEEPVIDWPPHTATRIKEWQANRKITLRIIGWLAECDVNGITVNEIAAHSGISKSAIRKVLSYSAGG